MKKVLLVITIILILIFVFYQNKENPQPIQAKLNEDKPIVKEVLGQEKLPKSKGEPAEILTEKILSGLDKAVLERKSECIENDLSYKNKKIVSEGFDQTITDFFDNVIKRTEAEERYQQYIKRLETRETKNLTNTLKEMNSLDICRGANSMVFLDKLIEAKNVNVPLLLKKINNILLANHFSTQNLALVFGKLGKMNSMGILPKNEVKEFQEIRDNFLKQVGDFSNNIEKIENDELAQGMFVEHFNNLREIGLNLKELLDRMSYY